MTETLPVSAQRLADWTLAMCEVASVTGDEAALCSRVEGWIRALGAEIVVKRVGAALVAYPPLAPDRPTVGLFGHLDTVKPAADQPLGIEGGRVYGCGASDMKGGLAVMLGLLAAREQLPGANLVAVFYDKEEGPATENGLEPLLALGVVPPLDFAFCLEPTDNRVQVGCLGGLHARVDFAGRRAHSARPWQGVNAIYAAIPLLTRLASWQRVAVPCGEGLTYYEVLTATMADTSNSRNVVPDRFSLNLNYRFAPGKSLDQAKRELLALVAGEAAVSFVDEAPAGAVCLDDPRLQAWLQALGLDVEPKQAWTDVARLTARGVSAVNFGPGETAQAHQARESVAVADLWRHYGALLAFFGPAPG